MPASRSHPTQGTSWRSGSGRLPTTQFRHTGARSKGPSHPLYRASGGSPSMAASKRTRDTERQKPGDSASIPDPGSKSASRKSVARGRKGAGAPPKGTGDGKPPVPGLSAGRRAEPLSDDPKHPTNDPNVWQAAVGRALADQYWVAAAWNWRIEAWSIPSETDPTIAYVIRRDRRVSRHGTYWWERFRCSCAAGQRGFLVCKHKAAVWIKRCDLEVNKGGPFKPV